MKRVVLISVLCWTLVSCGHLFAAGDPLLAAPGDPLLRVGKTNEWVQRTPDPVDRYLTGKITEVKRQLEDPAITNAGERKILQSELNRYEQQLSKHQAFEQRQFEARAARYAEAERSRQQLLSAMKSVTNSFEPVEEQLARTRADVARNMQLWSNYNRAKMMKDPEQAARAERELADYLTALTGRIDNTNYPKNMSLGEALKRLEKHSSKRTSSGLVHKRVVVLLSLAVVLLVPGAILLFKARRRLRNC